MKTKNIIIIVVSLFILFIGFKLYTNKKEINAQENIKEEKYAIPVKVAKVQMKTLTNPLIATGEFNGWEEVILVAESQGSIVALNFKEGDQIKKGQVIAKIDAASLQSQLTTARFSYSKLEKDVARYQRLEKAGAVSKTQLEDAQIQLENARTNISQIQRQLRFTTVKSTINGVVNDLMVEESSFVQLGTNIAEIVQSDKLKLIVNVSEDDLINIKEKQNVIIKTTVFPLTDFQGIVSNISIKADESRKFKITIAVNNNNPDQLRAGMFGEVHFESIKTNTEKALVIPREAIVNSLQNPQVYVVINNIAVLKNIKIGKVINENVIVLSGLSENDLIVNKGIINLKNNTLVKTTN